MKNTNKNDLYEKSLALHKEYNGKISIQNVCDVKTKEDLSLFYSPGVAAASLEIKNDPNKAYDYTLKKRVIAVVSDGSAVLGLGNVGAKAAIPVMEGKCMLFKAFADVEAFPICIDTQDTEELIKNIKNIAPVFAGINLEDISAPRCVEVENRLIEELDIPVFHDDQKGTAIVVGAAIKNVAKVLGLDLTKMRVALSGTGAAGGAIARMLKFIGIKEINAYNIQGVVSMSKYDSYDFALKSLIDDGIIDPREDCTTLADIVKGSDLFVGVSVANILTKEMVKSMNNKIVFALANPNPEITYEDAKDAGASVIATGRSDYPNQLNNVLAFPGLFKGVLESGAKKITQEMCVVAMNAICSYLKDEELSTTNILPSPLDKGVATHIANEIVKYVKSKEDNL